MTQTDKTIYNVILKDKPASKFTGVHSRVNYFDQLIIKLVVWGTNVMSLLKKFQRKNLFTYTPPT